MKLKAKAILAAIVSAIGLVFLLIRELLKGNVNTEHIDTFKKGIRDEKRKNDEIIKENVEKVKLQNKIIEEKNKQIRDMSMDEQLAYAKKMGLVK